jgi:hypothetical protein
MTASVTSSFAQAWNTMEGKRQLAETLRFVPASQSPDDQERHETGTLKRVAAHVARWDCAAALARALDCKVSVVELLLEAAERIPPAQRAGLLQRADAWIRGDARERELRQAKIIPTAVTRLVGGAARAVRELRVVGLVIGPSSPTGLGTTSTSPSATTNRPFQEHLPSPSRPFLGCARHPSGYVVLPQRSENVVIFPRNVRNVRSMRI